MGRNQAMLQPDSMKAETTSLPGSRRNPLEVFTSMFRRRSLRPSGGPSMTQSSDHIWDLLSTSPVRARNLEQDMEALRQSRHDNPYLQQQMERFSIQDDQADERQLLFPDEDADYQDLHKHLIRSPPPQFPQDVAQFVFPSSPPPEEESMMDSQLLGRSAPYAIQDGHSELEQQARDQDMPPEDVYRSVLPRTAATR
ncbi:hypothetical protein IscW_ISCW007027 [Ixodes scapularis]|uniref:Uncharacterized protein n=2 Tax=Ixodes scapularis TaxID=6945 RepID=B7PWB1_IXOSC|nr:hypothetical protein IscW_ISCW007027 [Ixodes scapularis]|eukprot:XP_002409649.1 hypothetical protein IscW_ISCW007027 [Ixodes scapularis]